MMACTAASQTTIGVRCRHFDGLRTGMVGAAASNSNPMVSLLPSGLCRGSNHDGVHRRLPDHDWSALPSFDGLRTEMVGAAASHSNP